MPRLPTLASIPESDRQPMPPLHAIGFAVLRMAAIQHDPVVTSDKITADLRKRFEHDCSQSFPMEVMLGRLNEAGDGLEYSPLVVTFLALLAENVATVVMWAYFLVEETRENGPVTVARLAEIFPTGFPTEEAIHRYWDAQKVKPPIPSIFGWNSDNQLDAPETWRSREYVKN